MAFNISLRAKNLVRKTDEIIPSRIARSLNFTIVKIDDSQLPRRVRGFIKTVKRRRYIVVNNALEEWQQEAVIAHELGHYILHPGYAAFSMFGRCFYCDTKKETEADAFAIELLNVKLEVDTTSIIEFLQHSEKNL